MSRGYLKYFILRVKKAKSCASSGECFWGNFDFYRNNEYPEERERSDSRYFRREKIKIYQKESDGKQLRMQITFYQV